MSSKRRLPSASESAEFSDSCSPVKVSSRMKKNKKRHHLPTRNGLHSDSDSEDGFPSLCKTQKDPQTEEFKERVVSERVNRKPLTTEERMKSVPVSQCLQSIGDFWDNMSHVDSSLLFHPDGLNSYRRSSVSAVIKDGMTDESRIETGRGSWSTGSRVLEIQAAVEALSFHKCRASVTDAWDKMQRLDGDLRNEATEELTLPLATHREDYSFTQDGLSHPQLAQQRKEVMERLFFKVFGTLGNRQAAALDYLPAMRTICRSEQLKERGKVKRRRGKCFCASERVETSNDRLQSASFYMDVFSAVAPHVLSYVTNMNYTDRGTERRIRGDPD
ncbi:hypothetical protein XENOCAPTIV_023566 [Xenoophorus captivus]|uniref:Uncharacterized protein n=1 Tax=Xenoophorus captivus TaxID=1517983 RepID=A0ABV0QWC9_9TELE